MLQTSRGCSCLRSALPLARARSAPTKQTVQTIGGYGIPAIPTPPQKYLPTEATEPTEVSDARYSPTDCTDAHRLGGYGILPYPRSNQTIFPQNPTQPNHLCASVGGSSPAKASVNSVNSVGGLAQTNLEWVLWKEFGVRRGYGRDAIPSYENSHGLHGCAQIRRQNAT